MLTAAQRIHFDVNGYVLLKKVYSISECDQFISISDRMRDEEVLLNPRSEKEGMTVLFGTAFYDHHMLDTMMSERLRTPAEEILGGESRLEENQLIIFHCNKGNSAVSESAPPSDGWHRGLNPDFGSFESEGHYHCLLPKMLIYLTDNGAGAGTWVVPGSHRMTISTKEISDILDDSLVRYVPAEQGDVLLFGETLVHSSPKLHLKEERYLMVFAYAAHFMRPWSTSVDPPEGFEEGLTDEQRRFVYGEKRYSYRPR